MWPWDPLSLSKVKKEAAEEVEEEEARQISDYWTPMSLLRYSE